MKTAEEIKRGLEHCRNDKPCLDCKYADLRDRKYTCEDALLSDALAYIQKLEDGVDRVHKLVKRLEMPKAKLECTVRKIPEVAAETNKGVGEVLRCGECAFYRPEPMGDVMMCYGFANGHWTEPDDFCSRGRRRDNNEKD